ncbi:ubiquitin thioesterase OTU1 [Pseudovirgaria hyperparasitica]|uniref:Ubiquitin thioesterase OTU n=1 Tax=Pseudovirgaria hyperparasitica TaxID=470096 RepID=A0A6A6WFZ8_9PEZI|nr:ubiquitin thioesterase OTU1 [Pseudovirgaria hyperparasitica]KAF2760856.1 ubiquitin thioesterase OTU1 [Pseudovirgaria hyperparasitica]
MRIRLRAPSGVSIITVADDATVADLTSAISKETSLPSFDLKSGFPPQPLDLTSFDSSLSLKDTGLKLNGEQLIVLSRDVQAQMSHPLHAAPPTLSSQQPARQSKTSSQGSAQQPLSLSRSPRDLESDPPEVPIPSHQATMVLRVMPDDNSCMFRAVGSAVLSDSLDVMTELRSAVAQGIQANPDLYSAAVLQKSPDEYCKWIQREDSWGGAIELGILAQNFDIEICSISVQDLRVDRFNEGKDNRIILVYSGIHYDTIAMSPSDPPHTRADMPADVDIKLFGTWDEEVLEKARDLCKILQGKHYFTDTGGFDIKCNKCGWKGKGEKGAVAHANETGHYDFGEAS